MTQIILATCGNGYCGCDAEDVFFFDETATDNEISEDIYDWAVDNAESFAHIHFGWDEPYTDEEYEDYIDNYVDFGWRELTYEEYAKWCEDRGYSPNPEYKN